MKIRVIALLLALVLWWSLAFADNGGQASDSRLLTGIYEWIAKGLLAFLLVDIWRNQKALFKGHEDLSNEVSEMKGYCKGKSKDCP